MFPNQKFQRRRKYKLHATFLNATMVTAIEAPVEFEVSIGESFLKQHNLFLCRETFNRKLWKQVGRISSAMFEHNTTNKCCF
jgi:hypothetical protein